MYARVQNSLHSFSSLPRYWIISLLFKPGFIRFWVGLIKRDLLYKKHFNDHSPKPTGLGIPADRTAVPWASNPKPPVLPAVLSLRECPSKDPISREQELRWEGGGRKRQGREHTEKSNERCRQNSRSFGKTSLKSTFRSWMKSGTSREQHLHRREKFFNAAHRCEPPSMHANK